MVALKRLHVSRGFWISFVLLSILTVYGLLSGLFFIDVLIGLLVIIVGLHGLLYEYNTRLILKDRRNIRENFDYIVQWLDNSYSFLKSINTKHESRIHSLDTKRIESDEKLEETFRDAVKKIIEVENKLNKTIRLVGNDTKQAAMTERIQRLEKQIDSHLKEIEKEREDAENRLIRVSRRQRAVLRLIRKKGSMTIRDYKEAFKDEQNTALREINEMIERKLIKRAGKGRATRYELGF